MSGRCTMSGEAVLYASHGSASAAPTRSWVNTVTMACRSRRCARSTMLAMASALSSSRRSMFTGSRSPALSWYAANLDARDKSRSAMNHCVLIASAPASAAASTSSSARFAEPS